MRQIRQSSIAAAAAIAVVGLASLANAATVGYSTFSSFSSNTASYYTDTYSDVTAGHTTVAPRTTPGGITSTYASPASLGGDGQLYTYGGAISTNLPGALVVDFGAGSNVTAVGGDFRATNVYSTDFAAGQSLTIYATTVLGNTTTLNINTLAGSPPTGFAGFTSTDKIRSLTILGSSSLGLYPALETLYVGSAVAAPVPLPAAATMGLPLIGALGFWARKRKQQQQ